MGKTYTQEFKQKIVDLYLGGDSTYQLQKEYKVDGKAISRWVKAFGHELIPRSRPRSLEFKRKIVDVYLSGVSSYQILKEYGISPENTCRWLREFGVSIRRQYAELSEDGSMKSCSICEVMKPLDAFSLCPSGVAGRNPGCKNCCNSLRRQKVYKLSKEDFDLLLQSQGGVCAVCKKEPENTKGWVIDHDHECCPSKHKTCGQCIRGVLCSTCNSGLGLFKDNKEVLQNAISYLAENRKENSVIQGTRQGES